MNSNPSSQLDVIDIATLFNRLAQSPPGGSFVLLDVRAKHELFAGHIAGAKHLPLDGLREDVQRLIPDKSTSVVLYCATGVRSRRAAETLLELGYSSVAHVEAGFSAWKAQAYPIAHTLVSDSEALLTERQRERYSRHLNLPRFGEAEQRRLLNSRVLLLGLGGLGTPAAQYLAAAGIGRLGLLDDDVVELSNLQRQILHATSRLGVHKVDSASAVLTDLNRDVTTIPYKIRLNRGNIDDIFAKGWDVIIDGSDNYSTRYLVNDACYFHAIPLIHGSVHRFEGRVMTLQKGRGPCYRCVYSKPPPAHLTQSCDAGGVLGVLPGVIGVLQATEAIKLILGLGEPLFGRLLTYDALSMQFRTLKVPRDPACSLCGENPTITTYIDYENFCTPRSQS
jgi:molybdopterin/thiamine biosynthesis adenylyltransferase/rhodanese-related sulfurtransferase